MNGFTNFVNHSNKRAEQAEKPDEPDKSRGGKEESLLWFARECQGVKMGPDLCSAA